MPAAVLHQYEISPFCEKVRRILHLKGVPFTVRNVSLTGAGKALRELTPIGKLPVLEIDGRRIPDSTEIARFLDAEIPEPPLWPDAPRDRALCHVLEDWADESLYFYEMAMRLTWPANAPRWSTELAKADPAPVRAIAPALVPRIIRQRTRAQGVGRKPQAMVLDELDRHLEAIEELLAGADWLVGGRLTLADLAVASQLRAIDGAVEGRARIAAHPTARAWLVRVDEASLPAGERLT